MILVDSSAWINHFQNFDPALAGILDRGEAVCHPMILGELACGNLRPREEALRWLRDLPVISVCSDDLVLHALEAREWYGRGIGWVDAHLLAACLVSRAKLLTHDIRLKRLAHAEGCTYAG